ncbi:MAG: hypothetical protein LAN37_10935 [Acidobacteriia bacterium]|nr:hypothetical protein [Terriglobia bacterium]
MRAVAILGPNATIQDVRRFDLPGVRLEPLSPGNPLAGADAALVFGGDGTVHDHLPEFIVNQVPVLPVPLGSGNDFHRAVGFADVAAALSAWKRFCSGESSTRRIDLGMISRIVPGAETRFVSYFCCVAGVGLDSEANRRANAMARWLRANGGYVAAVVGAVAAFRPQRIRIEAEGQPGATVPHVLSEPAMFVAFGNAQSYGGGMRITPQARLDDGRLDVCFVRRVNKARLLRLFPTVFSGKHLAIKEVEYFQAERARVETESPLDVYADGEFICQTPVEMTVAPKAMRVLTAGG